MTRIVTPELLDHLACDDPRAIRSRRDLQRINRLMGHADFIATRLRQPDAPASIGTLIELGAGDGTFLLRVARQLGACREKMRAVLVDRQSVVSAKTREAFEKLGWGIEIAAADVFDWLAQTTPQGNAAIVANLFLHHFAAEELRTLLRLASSKADMFIACEPRRSAFALTASRLLALIGCNRITRHDAVVSVRAGFIGRELLELWPAEPCWRAEEGETGLFSHYFVSSL